MVKERQSFTILYRNISYYSEVRVAEVVVVLVALEDSIKFMPLAEKCTCSEVLVDESLRDG